MTTTTTTASQQHQLTYHHFRKSLEIDEGFKTGIDNLYALSNREYNEIIYEEYKEPENLKESAILGIISILLALPKMVELLAKGLKVMINALRKLFGKDPSEESVLDKVVSFTHKWHKSYIKATKFALEKTKVFDKAKITDEEEKNRAAEVVFYTIVFGFLIYSGIATVSGLTSLAKEAGSHGLDVGHISHTALEGILTSIKSAEVKTFIAKFV